uniref:Uncharacterized protein n=1 Tax=Cynoglossus semilaevis TaxID=244447 RepID=A0A3P8X405_CYNSE
TKPTSLLCILMWSRPNIHPAQTMGLGMSKDTENTGVVRVLLTTRAPCDDMTRFPTLSSDHGGKRRPKFLEKDWRMAQASLSRLPEAKP